MIEWIIIAAVLLLVLVVVGISRGGRDRDGAEPVGWSRDANWRVVAPLARSDMQMVLRHPAFLTGVVLTPFMLIAATADASSWLVASVDIALGLVPLAWLTIVATNLVALRPRRSGGGELFASLPAPQSVRSSALLAAAAGPVVVAGMLAAAWVMMIGTRGEDLRGSPRWEEVAVGTAIVAGGVCVGVAVARWLPNGGFGLLAAAATMVVQVRFLDVTTWPWDRDEGDSLRFLAFLVEPTSVGDDLLDIRPSGWHLLYLAGLVTIMAGVALARDGMRRSIAVVLSTGVLVTAGAGWMQTRPVSDTREDAIVSYLTEPEAHQTCGVWDGVRFCAYPGFVADVSGWRTGVEATLAVLPSAASEGRSPLHVVQRPAIVVGDAHCLPTAFEGSLPRGVARRVSPEQLWPADGQVHPPFRQESFPCSDRDARGFFLAVQTAAWAVGLPPAPHGHDVRGAATNQARAAIALWAGAAATPDGARTLGDVTTEGSHDGNVIDFDGWDAPPMWGVDFAVADAALAQAMLLLPTAEVRTVLAADWSRWIDPRTPSSALAEQLGVVSGNS